MIAQTAFNLSYFAQKSLAASLLGTTPRKIDSVDVIDGHALVTESGAVYAIAIPLDELEAEHDRQRQVRGKELTVENAPDGYDVTGGDEPHYVYPDPDSEYLACDCHDYQRQHEAGRDRSYCKHIAAVELSDRQAMDAIYAAAKADCGW